MEKEKKQYANTDEVSELSAKLNQPHEFAKIFCAAAKEQVSIREELMLLQKTL